MEAKMALYAFGMDNSDNSSFDASSRGVRDSNVNYCRLI
jgi:hypothetical protein